jgi:hypothetical protein
MVRYEIGNTKVYTGMPKLPTKKISPRKNSTTHGTYLLTDTPGTAFHKVSMDIVGPLQTTESENSYILTIQGLLTKYSVAVSL